MNRVWLVAGWLGLAGCAGPVQDTPSLLATQAAPAKVARDFDRDGVVDADDRCPGAAGPLADGCPDPDSDGDGVLDSKDACKAEAGGQDDGCPIPDSDGDRLLDPDDKCVDVKESNNGFEDADGCPDEFPADLAALHGIVRGIVFDLDKDTIKPVSRKVLDAIVVTLQRYPDVRVEISGHSDDVDDRFIMRGAITARRAASVKRYLVEHGVDTARIETRGAGPDEPIASNKTAAGRKQNRRIEFTILVQ